MNKVKEVKTVGQLDLKNTDTKNILKQTYGYFAAPKADSAQDLLDSIKIDKIFK